MTATIALAAAGAARASDVVVADATGRTPVAASDGLVVFSSWDGSTYRLMLLSHGVTSVVPIAGYYQAFTPDLGPGPAGHELATYARCRAAPPGVREGCDLYQYDFSTGRERPVTRADTGANEVYGAVWHDELVFVRDYGSGVKRRPVVYRRSLTHGGRARRLAAAGDASDLDLRGTRIPFVKGDDFSSEPWLLTTGGRAQRLKSVPGSGAGIDAAVALGPTAFGGSVYWMLAVGNEHAFSEIHRYDRRTRRDERVPTRIDATASGFSYDGSAAYYAAPAAGGACESTDCRVQIHRVDDLTFEPAPEIVLNAQGITS